MLERLASRPRWLAGILVGLVLAAYIPAIFNGGYIWDDDVHVHENPYVQSTAGLAVLLTEPKRAMPARQWYPVTMAAFWLQYRFWGQSAWGYHLVNVLLHAATALLVWRILKRLDFRAAWLTAALFGVHPVCVESVAWISELKNTLSGFLYMCSAYLFVRHLGTRQTLALVGSVVMYTLALGAKTTAVGLPVALLLILWWRREWPRWEDVKKTIVYFPIGVIAGILTALHERDFVGADGGEWEFSILDRLMIAGRAAWFYIGKVLVPWNLTFIYPRWEIDAGVALQWLFPLSGIALLVGLWYARGRIGRGPLVALAFFVATAFPALGFFNVYPFRFSFVADHFQYLASIGIITLVAGAAATLAERLDWKAQQQRLASAALLAVLGGLTWFQCGMYESPAALWRATLARNPEAWIAHTNLGNIERRAGNLETAEQLYRNALELQPDLWQAHKSLAELLRDRGDLAEARQHLELALLSEDHAETRALLGMVLLDGGDLDAARTQFERARQQFPKLPAPHAGLARLELDAGNYAAAREHYLAAAHRYEQILPNVPPRKVQQLRGALSNLLVNLSACCVKVGRSEEAERHLRTALEINPEHALAATNLGVSLAGQGKHAEAARAFEKALRRHGGATNLQYLIRALLAAGDLEAANKRATQARKAGVPIPVDLIPRLE